MKNHLFLFLFVFLVINLYSIELWNGLMTEMSKDEVINYVKINLKVEQPIIQQTMIHKANEIGNEIVYEIFTNPVELVIRIYSPLPTYAQNYNSYGKRYEPNINLYFYKNKLFAIYIIFSLPSEEILNNLISQYGIYNDRETRTHDNPFGGTYTNIHYIWKIKERLLFLRDRGLWYIDRISSEEYIKAIEEEKIKKENEQKRAEEERIKAAKEGLKL
jgi:hypothetical protein